MSCHIGIASLAGFPSQPSVLIAASRWASLVPLMEIMALRISADVCHERIMVVNVG